MAALSRTPVDGLTMGTFTPTMPADVYVDGLLGSDSNLGTIGAPFQTIQRALDCCGYRGRINLRNNQTFTLGADLDMELNSTISARTNWANGHLTIRGYKDARDDGGVAHIDGNGTVTNIWPVHGPTGSNYRNYLFADLKFGNTTGAVVPSSNARVSYYNCEVYGNGGATALVDGTGGSNFQMYSYFHGNGNTQNLISLARGLNFMCVYEQDQWNNQFPGTCEGQNDQCVLVKCLILHRGGGNGLNIYGPLHAVGNTIVALENLGAQGGAAWGIAVNGNSGSFELLVGNIIRGFNLTSNGGSKTIWTGGDFGIDVSEVVMFDQNTIFDSYIDWLTQETWWGIYTERTDDPQQVDPTIAGANWSLKRSSPLVNKLGQATGRYSLGGVGYTGKTQSLMDHGVGDRSDVAPENQQGMQRRTNFT